MGIDPISIILFVASTAYQISQQNKMKRAADKRKGFNITVSGVATSIPVAYGKNILGGIEVKHLVASNYTASGAFVNNADNIFMEQMTAVDAIGGSKNEFLHVQYALCAEGIEGVQWVKVNQQDYNSTAEKFSHIIRTRNNGGQFDILAGANGLPFTNKFTGTASASATFRLNRDDYNYNGMPQMEFLVKGRKVRWIEENSGVYTLNSNFVYSNNPALCLLDYLMNSDFGRGLSVNEVDLESFYKATNVCDTIVATDRLVAGQINGQKTVHTVADLGSRPTNLEKHTYENELWYTTASSQYWYWDKTAWVETTLTSTRPIPLYECNLALDTSDNIRDNIERIMNTMGLAELTWSSEGKYKLLLEHPADASALNALVDANHYFDEESIIRDSVALSWPSASSRLNQATVSFLNEHEDFKEDTVTWPPSYGSVHNAYLAEDNNQPFQSDIIADGVTDPYHAIAMAEQAVRKVRTIFTLNLTVSKKGLNLEPGDFINVTSANANISNEVFRVEGIEIRNDFTVSLTCYKFDQDALAWNVADDIAYSTVPVFDFSVAAPTSGSFDSTTIDNLGTGSGKLSWTAADDVAATEYLVEISNDDMATWQTLGSTRSTSFDVVGLVTGFYDFSIRSRSPAGTLSDRLLVEDTSIDLVTVGKVAVIYADTVDLLTNTQSYTLGSNTFVTYYEYNGDRPTLPVRSGVLFFKFAGDDGTDGTPGTNGSPGANGTNGQAIWPIYATNSAGSSQSFSSSGKDYVTFYESITQPTLPVTGQTFIKFVGDDGTNGNNGTNGTNGSPGSNGSAGPKFASRRVYQSGTTAPSVPTSASITWSSGSISGLGSWSLTPPTIDASSTTYWYFTDINFVDVTGTASSTTGTATAATRNINFDGIVSFTNLNTRLADSQTVIDGGRITTGTINADLVNVTNISATGVKTAITGSTAANLGAEINNTLYPMAYHGYNSKSSTQTGSSLPSLGLNNIALKNGDVFYNTSDNFTYRYTGSSWVKFSIQADSIIANYVYAGTVNATQINAGTLNADRINIDGVTLDTSAGQLLIKTGGVGTAQVLSGAISTASTSFTNSANVSFAAGSGSIISSVSATADPGDKFLGVITVGWYSNSSAAVPAINQYAYLNGAGMGLLFHANKPVPTYHGGSVLTGVFQYVGFASGTATLDFRPAQGYSSTQGVIANQIRMNLIRLKR